MATYNSSSANQRDPGHPPYPESSIAGNMLHLNYSSSCSYSDAFSGNVQAQQNCVLLPLPSTMVSQGLFAGVPNMVASHLGDHTYTGQGDRRNEMLFMQTIGGSMNGTDDLVRDSITDDPQMGLRAQSVILNGQNLSLQQSSISTMQNQGLSLSLSTQVPMPPYQYRPSGADISFLGPNRSIPGNSGSFRDGNNINKQMHSYLSPHGQPDLTNSIPKSKYLKAAQELLDDVVNVKEALRHRADKSQSLASAGTAGCNDTDKSKSEDKPLNHQESTANSSTEISPSERQDLQNKVTKLLAMLDEVDRRYKQYYHQMQIVVSSFDVIAGSGAAKPYTALALQTISRHFRCLRDAISGQIRATRKILGEQDTSTSKGSGISRLRYIDQQLRQQRAMQQFGMMQQHAWRPQRGLPESSVSILRAWLFEHFLHPYPKDSEKLMLARQTGLTRSQVSNWFINARVRLWKPMIEDMYKEELGDNEIDSNSSSVNPPKDKGEIRSSEDCEDLHSPSDERHQASQFSSSSKSAVMPTMVLCGSSDLQNSASAVDGYVNRKLNDERVNGDDCRLLQDAITNTDGNARFMSYQMSELGSYENSGVSLTLGLQHCNGGLSMSNVQQNFLAMQGEDVYSSVTPIGTNAAEFDYLSAEDRQRNIAGGSGFRTMLAFVTQKRMLARYRCTIRVR
ncbi:BEL1-like homeodomain protein 6 [Typha latifolia]|uniref:BEL1-like homeodomain protein 6 n=1 Tax=Typha latifolia TaxID=4733 RepID=UPI003C2E46FC